MYISVVIPAFNESGKIVTDIKAAAAFLHDNNMIGEVIVVDDGSTDNTSQLARDCGMNMPDRVSLELINDGEHHGKGFAVHRGIAVSRGEYVIFADSGCCVPYDCALVGLELIKSGKCDLAHGSRKLKASTITRNQTPYRRLCGALFHRLVAGYMKIPKTLSDTQCGFKIYRGEAARKLHDQCLSGGFVFDIEIILLALKAGYTIEEFPITWTCDRDSRLHPGRNLRSIIRELVDIRRRLIV